MTDEQQRFVDAYRGGASGRDAASVAGLPVLVTGHPEGFYVYGLVQPSSGQVFYVGKGKGGRWRCHYSLSSSDRNVWKQVRIREVGSKACIVFGAGLSEAEALRQERALIVALRETLTNIAPGCCSELERSKAFAADLLGRVIPFDAWLAIGPRPAHHVDMYHRIVLELEKMAAFGWQSTVVFRL